MLGGAFKCHMKCRTNHWIKLRHLRQGVWSPQSPLSSAPATNATNINTLHIPKMPLGGSTASIEDQWATVYGVTQPIRNAG